ncbi:MAG: hypothetical protein J6C85_01385 [Alphaproteobacteria bacterium]|nr:hypothetical protein [Alphaproteobacteria bacterium]
MAKLLFFLMLISLPALADDIAAPVANETPEVIKELEALPVATKQNVTEPEPEETILHTVKKKIIPIPECHSPKLLNSAREHIATFLRTSATNSTLFRRRRHFILKSLDAFTTENIADYKTSAQSPVSDIIVDLKMNGGVLEENMRLCKNENINQAERPLFLLIWPEDGKYKVRIINLSDKRYVNLETSFIYEE